MCRWGTAQVLALLNQSTDMIKDKNFMTKPVSSTAVLQSGLSFKALQNAGSGKKKKRTGNGNSSKTPLETRMIRGPRFPPDFCSDRTMRCIRRWQSAESVALAAQQFTIADGHNQFLHITSATTTAGCYVDSWRIRKISFWTINYVDNGTTVTFEPFTFDSANNTFVDREVVYVCSSRSEAEPGHMCIIPAKDTPLGGWHRTNTTNSTGVLFQLNVDNGGASSGNWATTTMDIEFEYSLNLYGGQTAYTKTVTAGTQGNMGGTNLFTLGFLLQGVNTLV